jgi:DNA-binding transcriptional LysR family regulator
MKQRWIIAAMPLTRVTLRQIEAFSAVADEGSFTAAAAALGLSPSAVSQLVAELEATLGFRLFDRTTRKVQLSSAGRDFSGSAHSLLRHAQAAEQAAADLRNRAAGVVRIGAPMVLAALVLPLAIRDHQVARPKVVARIVDTPVEQLLERLQRGDLDLAVGPDLPGGETLPRDVVFRSPWVLWCAPSHPLAARRQLRWRDLRDVALVSAGTDHRVSVQRMRANEPDEDRITPVHVVDHMSTALGLAAQGLAATLAPDYVSVMAEPMGLVHRRVLAPETIREVCVYRPSARSTTPAAEGLADHLREWLPAWRQRTTPRRSR